MLTHGGLLQPLTPGPWLHPSSGPHFHQTHTTRIVDGALAGRPFRQPASHSSGRITDLSGTSTLPHNVKFGENKPALNTQPDFPCLKTQLPHKKCKTPTFWSLANTFSGSLRPARAAFQLHRGQALHSILIPQSWLFAHLKNHTGDRAGVFKLESVWKQY